MLAARHCRKMGAFGRTKLWVSWFI